MFGRNQYPRIVEVMPDGFTFEEALTEASYLAEQGLTGEETTVAVSNRTFVALSPTDTVLAKFEMPLEKEGN